MIVLLFPNKFVFCSLLDVWPIEQLNGICEYLLPSLSDRLPPTCPVTLFKQPTSKLRYQSTKMKINSMASEYKTCEDKTCEDKTFRQSIIPTIKAVNITLRKLTINSKWCNKLPVHP